MECREAMGGGNDTVHGGLGLDTLTGGAGNDVFVFDTPAVSTSRDTITDFTVGEDKIHLKASLFGLTAPIGGSLTTATFFNGAAATEASHRIGYDQATGKLVYDADGVGGAAPIEIATLTNPVKPVLSASDFVVIA